ncbi:hypothetical protein C8F04DRAFT_111856 [Mycena alexandri]|uniref:F-box domain-containing protein n=1 Tax=Mycena alexandri TaxID=1745969 RepID=A0AAD6T9F6_9AGAR|nr:hypothetical protein C8F04DRAFT_111856 [Mycena alexandri]
MPIHLLDFPPEILILILSHLYLPTLTACLAINRRVKSIIDGSTLLQYRLAAQAACVEDNPLNTTTNSAHKLLALQRRQTAFAELVPTSVSSVPGLDDVALDSDNITYAFSGPIFAVTERDTLMGLRWVSLAVTEPVFRRFEFAGYIQDFSLAIPEADLLVIVWSSEPLQNQTAASDVVVELRFYEMSTQSAHRMACDHVIPVTIFGASLLSFLVDICGPNVFLLVDYYLDHSDTTHTRLLIYDWKLGCLLRSFDDYSTAAFLSPDVILLAQMVTGTFELWGVPEGTVTGPDISLELPVLAKPGRYEILTIDSTPKGYGSASSQEPFYSSFADSNVGFDVVFEFDDESEGDLLLVISRRALLQLRSSTEERGKVLPWREWGPRIAQWPDMDHFGPDWPTKIHGQCCALIGPAGRMQLADFNPYSYRKLLGTERDDSGQTTTRAGLTKAVVSLREKDRVIGTGLFGEEVRANLGYLVIDSALEAMDQYSGFFVGEKSIEPVTPGEKMSLDFWHFG